MKVLICFLIWILTLGPLIFGAEWCYEGNCGPRNWKGKCKFGTSQSPINIVLAKTVKARPGNTGPKKVLRFSKEYYQFKDFEIINNGHTVQISLVPPPDGSTPPKSDMLLVEGAGWRGQYAFLQMHFHWRSEHKVKGTRFPLELHMVHEQVNGNGGLGVLGILYGNTSTGSNVLRPIIEMLPRVNSPNSTPVSGLSLNLSSLFPNVWDVFRYEGSLTTPPCTEEILWSVFTQRMPVSSSQVAEFRKLLDENGYPIRKNFRPVKPLVTKTRQRIIWMPVDKSKMVENAF